MRKRSQVGRPTQPGGSDSPRRSRAVSQVGLPFSPAGAAEVGPAGRPDCAVNCYMDGGDLMVVIPDASTPSGIRVRRTRPEYVCFVLADDLPVEMLRSVREHYLVKGLSRDGDWLRVAWKDAGARAQYCKAFAKENIPTHDGNVGPVLRYMLDGGLQVAAPRVAYLDLETDSRVSFSRKEEMRILTWALVDAAGAARVGVLAEDTNEAEQSLLHDLWDELDRFDLVASWNGDRFDFPVLKARTAARGIQVPWSRWLWLDHLELFRRMNMMAAESGDEKQSYALGAICQAVLGEGKDDLDASKSWQYWAEGGEARRRLARYNVKDADLERRLEDKTGYVALLVTLAQACGTFPDSRGILPTVQVESLLHRLAEKRGLRFETVVGQRRTGDPYRGAYVMEPTEQGIVKNVHVADFSGLYPSIIRTWNMSPETKLEFKIGKKPGRGWAWGREGEALTPITGVVFRTDVEGALPGAVAEMMRLRKSWNDKKSAATPGTDEWKDADRRSTAYKIAANACYGVTGQPAFRFYDRDVAESVSQAGVWLIQETIKAAEARGMRVIYADTDGAFVAGCTRDEFSEFAGWCNRELYPRLLGQVGCQETGLINLAYEKAFERIIFTVKKHYVGRYSHYKGTPATKDSKPEVKGLEYKRGDAIRLARRLQGEVIDLLVGQIRGGIEDPKLFEAVLDEWRHRTLERPLDLEDVVISKGLGKDLNQYATKTKKDGSSARQLPHIEIARILENRGRDVAQGTKIDYVIVDGSAKPMTVIPAEDWAGEVDRDATWESLVAPPTIRLLAAAFPGHEWTALGWARPKLRDGRGRKMKGPRGPELF